MLKTSLTNRDTTARSFGKLSGSPFARRTEKRVANGVVSMVTGEWHDVAHYEGLQLDH